MGANTYTHTQHKHTHTHMHSPVAAGVEDPLVDAMRAREADREGLRAGGWQQVMKLRVSVFGVYCLVSIPVHTNAHALAACRGLVVVLGAS